MKSAVNYQCTVFHVKNYFNKIYGICSFEVYEKAILWLTISHVPLPFSVQTQFLFHWHHAFKHDKSYKKFYLYHALKKFYKRKTSRCLSVPFNLCSTMYKIYFTYPLTGFHIPPGSTYSTDSELHVPPVQNHWHRTKVTDPVLKFRAYHAFRIP